MTKITHQQKRATHALQQVSQMNPANCGHYVSYVSALPAQIVSNGLGQSLATLLAAAKGDRSDPHYLLCHHLTDWLCHSVVSAANGGGPVQVLESLVSRDQETYLNAQAESLAYLNWLKKFARAILPEADTQDKESEINGADI